MTHYHIYGIGAALVDTEITVSDSDLTAMAVAKGVMTLVDEPRQSQLISYLSEHQIAHKVSGGSGANTIIAANYFGCDNFYSCKVADDDNGRFYLQDIKDAGVAYPNHLPAAEGITGKCLVMITPDAERSMNTFLGISETVSVNELQRDAIATAEYVYIEGYLVSSTTGRAAAIELRKLAQANNTRTSLSLSDPAMVQFFRDGLVDMIGDGVDLLFCNRDEALGFTQTHSLDHAVEALKKYCKTFAITCGAEGALVFDGNALLKTNAYPTKAIDTNGAGDMFAGAFLYALTHGYDYKTAGDFANFASAKVVAQFGPRLKAAQHRELKDAFFK
ncbi:adenosine kinase [Cellvibrio sp. PSBB006]|uniref:adenosine kinase n=1 Tax=Cellvibrio sp. PSBB006 TaxID=1987723 RepID=UPI000B3B99F7|nr:adenosine kinase [Cellvibrio sp. PSBB006]ARU29054.1 adenosine kinase [Cellvibrio sp. PSBB006]